MIEHLIEENKCRTLFATHYHEVTQLEGLGNAACYSTAVYELPEQIVFAHKVVRGKAKKSYAVHVAQLSGIPSPVIHRATQILSLLEEQKNLLQENTRTILNKFTPNANLITSHKEDLQSTPLAFTHLGKVENEEDLKKQKERERKSLEEKKKMEKFENLSNFISGLNIDEISPKQALDLIYQMKKDVISK